MRRFPLLLMAALLAACVGPAEAEELAPEPFEPVVEPGVERDVERDESEAALEAEADDGPPLTTRPLRLLSTLRGADPADSRATILDIESNAIATYGPGDEVRPSLVVEQIGVDEVLLRDHSGEPSDEDGQLERVVIGAEPVALRPDYALYPDLVEETLPHEMDMAVRLESGPGFRVRTPAHAWATPRTVHLIQRAFTRYMQHGLGGPTVLIGDLSRHEGGHFPPHLSHQDGRDVDIGYVLKSEHGRTFATATSRTIDVRRSWALIESFLYSNQVRYIFMDYAIQELLYEEALASGYPPHQVEAWFQYPHGSSSMHGIIRDWRGHDDHFHVRFRD